MEHLGESWIAREFDPVLRISELKLKGSHNLSNVLAALALAELMEWPLNSSLKAACEFAGLPHRCQWVAEKMGVSFYNDSKGTNVGATCAAIHGLKSEAR